MKHSISSFLTTLAVMVLAGCTDEIYKEATSEGYIYSSTPLAVNVSPSNISFDADAARHFNGSPLVTASDSWTASGVNTSWVTTFSPMTGSAGSTSLDISVAPKPDPESRVNIVGFKLDRNDVFTSALTITQTGQAYRFAIKSYDDVARTFSAAGETKIFEIDTNIPVGNPVTATVTSTSSSPIQDCMAEVTPDHRLKLTLKPASGYSSRTYTVQLVTYVNDIDFRSSIMVYQNGISVSGSTNSVTIPAIGGSADCTFSSNISCNVYKDADWIQISPSALTVGSTTVKISVATNTTSSARSGKVYVVRNGVDGSFSNSLYTVTVTQAAADVSGGTTMVFPAAGGSLTEVLRNNVACTVVADASWLSVTPAICQPGENTLTVTAAPNPYLADRSSTISVYPASGEKTPLHRITVTQRAITGSVTENVYSGLSARGDKVTVDFTCDVDWTATTSSTFVSISPSSGTAGTTKVELLLAPNNSVNQRSAEVKFFTKAGGQIGKTVYLYQYGAKATADPSTLTFSSRGETLAVTVESDTEIAPIEAPEWISLSTSTLPVGTSQLSLTAAPNPYLADRSSTVTLYPASGERTPLYKIGVTQQAVTGGVTENVYSNLSARGEKVTVDFTCEGPWTATTSATFVSVSPAEGQSGTTPVEITLAPNTSSDSRNAEVKFFTLAGGQIGKTVYLYQRGAKTTVNPSSLTFAPGGATLEVQVDSDVDITTISAPEWIEISPETLAVGSSSLSLKAGKNPVVESRVGKVILQSSDGFERATIDVAQEPAGLTDDNDVLLSWKSQIYEVPLNVTDNWTALLSSTGWLRLGAASGTPTDNLILIVDENASEQYREGGVRLNSGGKTTDIRVVQQGQYIHVDGASATLPLTASSLEISVSSTIGSSVSEIRYLDDSTGWLSLDGQESGDGIETYSFKAAENNCAFTRRAEIVFEPTDVSGSVVHSGVIYTVYQHGRTLSLSQSAIYANADGGRSEIIVITADGTYEVVNTDTSSWFTISHTGNAFYLDLLPNNTGTPRSGSVTVYLSGLPAGQELKVILPVIQTNNIIDISVEPFKPNVDYR